MIKMLGSIGSVVLLAILYFPLAGWAEDGKCLTCHEGIEKFSEVQGMAHLTCTDCHKGDASATSREKAHNDMWANPSDLRVVDKTCGTCHPQDVENMKKSLHATSAGVISGARYAWGAQDRNGIYANYPVEDENPEGQHAVKSLDQVPSYDPSQPVGAENHPVDDYLRNQCLRCHIWSDGHQREGDYRSSGCAACHVLYSDEGTYEGGDKAIPDDQKDRPRFHRLTSKINETQCLHCHNRGGRTGVSYIGTMEADPYGTPWTENGEKQPKLHGKYYNHLTKNVHYEMGMTCIDCHTKQDLHGDGNIYVKREQAVEIECESCHGTQEQVSDMKSAWGNRLSNLKKKNGKIILIGKLDGKEHVVPQIAEAKFSAEGKTAHITVPSHMESLECYACHATWAPQCYGCHAKQDVGKPSGDWLNPKLGEDPSVASKKSNRQQSAYAWKESRSYLRWETPVLGINTEDKVSTFIPGCQAIYTQMEGEKNLVHNKIYTTVDGTSGIGTNPIQPHTTTKEARTCADCHMSRKAIGLGSGFWKPQANGLPIDFELEQIVDREGNQIQQTAHEGARPFNAQEQQKIMKVGTCLGCHEAEKGFWEKTVKKYGIKGAPSDEMHQKAIKKILKSAN